MFGIAPPPVFSRKVPHNLYVFYLENKLLLISINFTPKTSHSCLTKMVHYCWWFRNPANQLRLVVYPSIYQGFCLHPRWFSRRISEPSTVCFPGMFCSLLRPLIHPKRFLKTTEPGSSVEDKSSQWPMAVELLMEQSQQRRSEPVNHWRTTSDLVLFREVNQKWIRFKGVSILHKTISTIYRFNSFPS